jgi:hypothetical protein
VYAYRFFGYLYGRIPEALKREVPAKVNVNQIIKVKKE